MTQTNPVQQAIIEQVAHGLRERGDRQRPTYIVVDDATVRVHMKRSGTGANVQNTDVRYDSGPDTYTVTVHSFGSPRLNKAGEWTEPAKNTVKFRNIYADQLAYFCGFGGISGGKMGGLAKMKNWEMARFCPE